MVLGATGATGHIAQSAEELACEDKEGAMRTKTAAKAEYTQMCDR